jgi:hypothetical protein
MIQDKEKRIANSHKESISRLKVWSKIGVERPVKRVDIEHITDQNQKFLVAPFAFETEGLYGGSRAFSYP